MIKQIQFTFWLLLFASLSGNSLSAQNPVPTVQEPVYFDVSPPLRDVAIQPPFQKDTIKRNTEMGIRSYPNAATALPKGEDEARQKEMGTWNALDGATINFEGVSNRNGVIPPDTQGDVGPDHYFQVVNVSFQIWDKSGTSLYGPADLTTIWSGIAISSITDPVVIYDEQADRWFVSVFKSSSPYKIYIAVSQTGDPTGSWNRWVYDWASKPDYAKYGVWRDGYYYASNTIGGQDVGVFERSVMLSGGASPKLVTFSNPNRPVVGFHCIMPLDNDGQFAPVASPGLFATINNDAWSGTDQLWIYQLAVNWANTALSTFTRTQQINVTAFDSDFGPNWDNIKQPGTAQELDAVPEVLMFRAQYRNFGSYQAIVCCHSVDVDNTDHAGVRWYELRKTAASWFIQQQSTYAPDAQSRWLGSIAMNKFGDIALGYSVSSTTVYPSIRFTGRKAGDALNTMTMAEETILAGSHSQIGWNRWGDYSCMTVDPSDDVRFWYTNEYTDGSGSWRTRVAAFSFGSSCYASGGCDEFISRVKTGTIDNNTGCIGYGDYSDQSTSIPLNGAQVITVTNGNPVYVEDQCGIWVDWNRDGDFYDANETIAVSGSPGVGPYTATIDPPASATIGACIMRVRITYNTTPVSCSVDTYGEVEDYTINVTPTATDTEWIGVTSSDWNTGSNWSLGTVPTATLNVYINAATPHSATIGNGVNAYTGYLSLNSGATLTQNLTSSLFVYGTFDAGFGQFTMNNSSCFLYLRGDSDALWWDDNQNDTYTNVVIWKSNSTALVTMQQNMTCSGIFEVYSGIFALSSNKVLTVNSTSSLAFTVGYQGKIILDSPNEGITVAGSIEFDDGSQAAISNGIITCATDFTVLSNTTNNIAFTGGTLIMNGSSTQYISDLDGGNLDLYNLTIAKPGGTCYIKSANLDINGSLVITGGAFSCNNGPSPTATYNISVAGNWTDAVGVSGFVESTGRVTFDGPGHQYVYGTENFNILEAKMGAALRVNNAACTVTCNQYDWTSGGIDIIVGTFTALDLADNGLYGTYWVNPGGTLNLTQDLAYGQFTDLHGEIHIFGGTMTVTGGIGQSYWPFLDNGIIQMSDGILDFRNNGIYLYNGGNTLTENITGGTIKTNLSFTSDRTDFNPAGGTIELYGNSDAYFNQGAGSTFNNVLINKASKSANGEDLGTVPVINSEVSVPSSRKLLPQPNTRSNTVLVNGNLNILGSLTIETGTFDLNSFTVDVANDVNINSANLKMTYWTDKLTTQNMNWNAGSNDNINNGEIHAYIWTFNDGTNAMLEAANTAYITGGIFPNDPDATFGNLVAVPISKGKFDTKAYYPIRVAGTFTIQSGAIWWMGVDLYVNGVFDIQSGASINLNGTVTTYINSPFNLNGTFNVNQGNVLCHGIFSTAAGSSLLLNGGSFIADSPQPYAKGWEFINGNLTMHAGLFEITHNSINFSSTATTSISGGTLRTGGAFYAAAPGTFLPTGGVVEVIGSDVDDAIWCGNGNFFFNFLINRSPGVSSSLAGYDILIKNDLTIQSGIFNSLTQNITIEGNWTNNVGPDGFVEGTKTVTFSGPNPKDITTNETFNNLVINKTWVGTSGVEILSPLTVNVLGNLNLTQGTLQLNDNSTLNIAKDITFALNAGINAISGPGINISVGGNWMNNNTAAATTNSSFFGGTSTVTFNGSIDQTLNTSFTSESFYNLNVNKTAGFFSPNDVLKIGGNIQVLNGAWVDFTNGLAHELSGNIKIFATGGFYPKGNFTFTGNTNSTFENGGAGNYFLVNTRINKALAANTLTLLSPIQLFNSGTLTVDKGSVNLNGNYFRVVGNVNINNGGKIAINSDAWLEVGNAAALNVNSGGTIEAIGTAGHPAKVTHHAGYYTFNVNSGGTISANNALFEYTGTINGLNVKSGATVNATNCFHNSTFQNGDPSVANAALLTLDNSQTFTVNNALFPAASTAKNVAKNVNAGRVTFNTATGAFAGAAFEKDPFNLVDWTNSAITHTISLPTGWSGLSSYVMPTVTNLPTLFTPIAANFTILQTLAGVYYPAGSINTIGPWASQSAYSVKMNAAASLPISGNAETNKTFALGNGWNLMPVICNTNATTSTLVGGLGANLQIIKEIAGSKVYWPAFGIYTLNQLTPGKAYYVRMAAAGSVTFPANAADNGFIPDEPIRELTTPWNEIHRTAGSHVFAIQAEALTNLSQDDIIGIFTPEGLCAGNVQIVNINENHSIYAFADDQVTSETDGFTDGQPMIFKLFRPSTGEEFNMEVAYNSEMPNNDGLFVTEGISAIKALSILNTGLAENFARGLYIYPNPTNGVVTVGGITGIEQILVMSSEGAVVIRFTPKSDGNQVLDLSNLPAGFYQVQIRTSQGVVTRKVVKGR